jgi:hypothetical protein
MDTEGIVTEWIPMIFSECSSKVEAVACQEVWVEAKEEQEVLATNFTSNEIKSLIKCDYYHI